MALRVISEEEDGDRFILADDFEDVQEALDFAYSLAGEWEVQRRQWVTVATSSDDEEDL